jgi:SAM-dependent methyltransferase
MFTKSEAFYDAIYSWKQYEREAAQVRDIIKSRKRSDGNALLDVACGTGGHIAYLRDEFAVEGLDLDPKMLEIARTRHPGIAFHHGDMVDFDLGRPFDAVICLFSSIGYVKTAARLRQAIATMARHLCPGGVLVVEPYFSPTTWKQDRMPGANQAEQPDLKLVRMMVSSREGTVAKFDLHYLVGTPAGVEYFTEQHELGLFTVEEYRAAFAAAGLDVVHDEHGLIGRGLYTGARAI